MDFPRACTTNVQTLDTTACWHMLYAPLPHSDQPSYTAILTAITELRRSRILISHYENNLHVFGTLDHRPVADLGHICQQAGFQSLNDEAVEAASRNPALLKAVQGALAYALGQGLGVTRCGERSWLFPGESGNESTEIGVEAKIDGKGGLRLCTVVKEHGRLRGAGEIGQRVLLAPFGYEAVVSGQKAAVAGEQEEWKISVVAALGSEGVEAAEEEVWTFVEVQCGAETAVVQWPARFCFALDMQGTRTQDDGSDWKFWFGLDVENTYRNPLAIAEDWYNGSAEREEAMNAVNELPTHELDTAISNNNNPAIHDETPAELATSPPFAQRPDQQNVNGIYPTPPDGLVPGSAPAQPISSDTGPSVHAEDHAHQEFANDFNEPANVRGRGHSLASTVGAQDYQGNTDDLFGEDMEDLDFNSNEVGDADFNFFDEPDDEPTVMTGMLAERHMMDNTSHAGNHDAADVIDNSLSDAEAIAESDIPMVDGGGGLSKITGDPVEPAQDTPALAHEELHDFDHTDVEHDTANEASRPHKPLSPFGIKERLLPPPVPASAQQSQVQQPTPSSTRRASSFNPVEFREGFHLSAKYDSIPAFDPNQVCADSGLQLPSKRKKRHPEPVRKRPRLSDDSDSESEEDSYESASSASDDGLPPRMPWDTKKRKRGAGSVAQTPLTGAMERMWPEEAEKQEAGGFFVQKVDNLLRCVIEGTESSPAVAEAPQSETSSLQGSATVAPTDLTTIDTESLKPAQVLGINSQDLMCAAQLFAEQCTINKHYQDPRAMTDEPKENGNDSSSYGNVRDIISRLFPTTTDLDLNKLALIREAQPRPPQPKVQQRAPPRPEVPAGPEMFPFPPPHVRVQRADAHWEMLPSALSFWEALGLQPSSGTKNVRAYTIFPENRDLQDLLLDFMSELGAAYEGCKLGSHVHSTEYKDPYDDGMVPVTLEAGEQSLSQVLQAWAGACTQLARDLGEVACDESDRTLVIYMIDPFGTAQASQCLAACSWMLYKAYQDVIRGNVVGECSDLVVQIIPIDMVASRETLVIPDPNQLASIARQVYDRCPPSMAQDNTSPLPIAAAPAVELASPIPKKINFQLTADPPEDLLHEGSVMHLAYARSADGLWLTVAWTDNTGRYQNLTPFCLRGTTLADTITEIWKRTDDIISARRTSWRIFIVTTDAFDDSIKRCWKDVITTRPRPHPFNVALLSVDLAPSLTISPPSATETSATHPSVPGAGFLTPATTPQGSNTAFTVSPEASGAAPPTPAPSESAVATPAPVTSAPETDPDAHLVDLSDETWGVLLEASTCHNPFKLTLSADDTQPPPCPHLAHGALIKRGSANPNSQHRLPLLGVNLLWSVRVSANGAGFNDTTSNLESGLLLKQALWMYRNLGLLAKVRGLRGGEEGLWPWHVACVWAAGEGLVGMV